MIAAIRIYGRVNINTKIEETLFRLRMRRKYTCVLLEENEQSFKILKTIRNFIAYGKISEEMLKRLIETRGKSLPGKKKETSEKIVQEILKGKKLEEAGLKPFFAMHPPRKGIDSKHHFPQGVLGNHGEEINKLIERML
jgi:large subunit ribosomal protein L30